MLDGFAGDLWFVAIYLAIVLRLWNEFIPLTHVHWKFLILFLAIFSGVFCHAKQCQLADYYRNVHMFFAFGKEDSELDNSRQQRVLLNTTPKKRKLLVACLFCISTATIHIPRNLSLPICKT